MKRLPTYALTFALFLAACGGGRPQSTPTGLPPMDACLLLLPREAEEAAGGIELDTVAAPLDARVGDRSAKCSFGISLDGQLRVVSVEARRADSADEMRAIFERAKTSLTRIVRSPLVPVPEVGEEAVWATGKLFQLHARAERYHVIVTLEFGDEGDRALRASRIATAALERLKGNSTAASPPGTVVVVPEGE